MANEPITREEILLNAVATGEAAKLEPITREEMFLAKLGGADVNTPTPITRKEQFLAKAIESGTSGGGGSTPGGGGSAVADNDVRFLDYDGTLLYSYSVEEAQALTELPPLPTQPGLVCQGWNWTLEEIKSHNRAVDVGAMYITDDGKTRIYITIQEGQMSPHMSLCPNGAVTVDWGDGTEPDVVSGKSTSQIVSVTHEYARSGDYVILLSVDGELGFRANSPSSSGSYRGFFGHSSSTNDSLNSSYANCVKKIETGAGVVSFGDYSVYYCSSLRTISMPESLCTFGQSAFSNCVSLHGIVIPRNTVALANATFSSNRSMSSISLPKSCTSFGLSCFGSCMFDRITLPDGVIVLNNSTFSDCYLLKNIVLPDGLSDIGDSVFLHCYTMTGIKIPEGVISIGKRAFADCYALSNVVLPDSVVTLGTQVFSSQRTLTSFVFPDAITTVPGYLFQYVHSIAVIRFPKNLSEIGAGAFDQCYGMRVYDFTKCVSVPVLANTNAFTGIPADCEIRVPAALYDEWIAATNWATYASKIVAV